MNRSWRGHRVLWLAVAVTLAIPVAACRSSGDGDEQTTTTSAVVTTQASSTTSAPSSTTSTTTTTVEAGTKGYGGEVIVGIDEREEPPTLNPFAPGGDTAAVVRIGQAYLAGVQEIDGYTLELIPELVTELPTVANGGVTIGDDGSMTVRYQIRDEARWSDGVPISGEDFQFTLDTIRDPDLSIDTTTYEDIVATNVGPKTFSYTLAKPTALYELLFDTILPKHAVADSDFAADWDETLWPSAGPFVFGSWVKGESIRLVRNENYWKFDPETGQQLPYLEAVEFQFLPQESLTTAFRGREVDVIQLLQPVPETLETLEALEPDGATVEALSGPLWEHLSFQFGPGRFERNPSSANENLNFRKGVAYAIDYDRIVEDILGGQGGRLTSFLEAITPSIATGAWSQYSYDPELARQYFEQAKSELGVDTLSVVFTTTSNNDARVRLSGLLEAMFTDAGVEYENQLEVSQVFFGETLFDGTWDMGEWAWRGSPGLSGAISLFNRFDPDSSVPDVSNYYRWGTSDSSVIDDNTARFADIREQLQASVDPEVLVPLIQEGERILADQAVIIPLYANLTTAAVWADEVGGFKNNPTSAPFTWNMEEWYRADL